MTFDTFDNYYAKTYREALIGRTITNVFAFSDSMRDTFGWDTHDAEMAVFLTLDDGTAVVVQSDPEGNGPGFLNIIPPGEDV